MPRLPQRIRIVEDVPAKAVLVCAARGYFADDVHARCDSCGAPIYIYRWDRCGRKGQRCRVLARGTMNSCLLEFEDGWRMVTSRNALRRAK